MIGNQLIISTPEGIAFPLPLAGPITRFLAWCIDLATCLAVFTFISSLSSVFIFLSPDLSGGMLMVVFFTLNLTYNMVLEWLWRGQSLGKRLLGIRVMDVRGLRLRLSQVILRNLLRAVDLLPVLYLLGGVCLLLSRRNQRLGDLAANTVVVRTRRVPQPDVAQLRSPKYNSFRAYPHLEARLRQRLSPVEAGVIVQALLRRDELDPAARLRLCAELAEHLRQVVPFPESATLGVSDEQYLRNALDSIFHTARPAAGRVNGGPQTPTTKTARML